MIDSQKKYLLKLLLKRIGIEKIVLSNLEFSFSMLQNTYSNLSSNKIEELRKKYNFETYFDLIFPVYDKNLSIEEIRELIKFYSSDLGQKMVEGNFLKEVEEIGNTMIKNMEKEFLIISGY